MSYDPSKVAFIDTETTGLDPEWHHVWEVAVIVDDVEHVWQQRIPGYLPGSPLVAPLVDPWVLEHTGIRERYDHAAAMHPRDSIEWFAMFTQDRHLVGACPWFDSERLHRLHLRNRRVGVSADERRHPWHYHLIDIETLVVGRLAANERGHDDEGRRLDDVIQDLPWDGKDLSRFVGVDPDRFEQHTARGDARWAKAMFEVVMGGPIYRDPT